MRSGSIIVLVIAVMLVVGVVFALVWWQMADVLFPGTARKTGQRILGRGKGKAPSPEATVVRGFDEDKKGG